MKKTLAAATLVAFGIAPVIGYACEYNDASASATPPAQLALAPAPQASKAPAPVVVKAPEAKVVKQAIEKVKGPAPDATVAEAKRN